MLLADTLSATAVRGLGGLLENVFGGDEPQHPLELYQIAARAAVVYLVGLAIVRIGKSRIIGRSSIMDVIVGFILGSLLSRAITGHASMSGTFIASAVIVALHWLLTAIACRSHAFGKLIKGNARKVVEDGRMLVDDMYRSNISENDLLEHMRLNGVDDVTKVRVAHKERNGEVSIIKKQRPPAIVEVDVQAGVQTVRIALE